MKQLCLLLLVTTLLFSLGSCSEPYNDEDRYVFAEQDRKTDKDETQKETESETIIPTFTVSFNAFGGSHVKSQTLQEGALVSTPPSTTRNGYRFEGWYIDQAYTTQATFPFHVQKDMTLYAKWLCLEKTAHANTVKVKNWDDQKTTIVYITPSGLDMERLASLGYKMEITVSYDVHYERDYDGPDLSYWPGAPKYTISISDSDYVRAIQEDIETSKSAKSKTISFTDNVANLKNDKISLNISTDNIQNLIHFENITIQYSCTK